jgi:hypothetical protein
MKGGIHFTEPLPSSNRRDMHMDTDWREEFTWYAVDMDSGAKFNKDWFIDTQTACRSRKPTLTFFRMRKVD